MSNATIGGRIVPLSLGLVVVVIALAGCGQPGASPIPSTPIGATPPASLAGHPLIGMWTVDVTEADLAAGGIADPGGQNENSGRFTWTFAADGTWTQVQQRLDGAPINSPVFQGTFVVDGEQLIATTEFPEQYRDSGLHYTWAVDGDEARFDLLDPPDQVLPLIVETHPWRRAS